MLPAAELGRHKNTTGPARLCARPGAETA